MFQIINQIIKVQIIIRNHMRLDAEQFPRKIVILFVSHPLFVKNHLDHIKMDAQKLYAVPLFPGF